MALKADAVFEGGGVKGIGLVGGSLRLRRQGRFLQTWREPQPAPLYPHSLQWVTVQRKLKRA